MLLRLVQDGLGFHRRSASYAGHGPGTGRDKGGIRELGFRIVWAGFGA